jgi:hypothetical protein
MDEVKRTEQNMEELKSRVVISDDIPEGAAFIVPNQPTVNVDVGMDIDSDGNTVVAGVPAPIPENLRKILKKGRGVKPDKSKTLLDDLPNVEEEQFGDRKEV